MGAAACQRLTAGRGDPGPAWARITGPGQQSPAACASWWRRSAGLIWPPGYRGGMAETQREPVPRVDSGELDVALAFLSFARHCVLKKAGGLSDEQLRRVLTGSGTSVLGLVQHLAEAERYWFGHHLVGAAWDPGREHGMTVPAIAPLPTCYANTRRHRGQRPCDPRCRRPGSTFRCPGRGQPAHAAVGHRPHDERNCAAHRTRGHPPGTTRRHHRPLNPASAALTPATGSRTPPATR